MLLRRNFSNQYVEIGPLRDSSGAPITTSASAFVNNSAGAGTLVHRSNGVWGYTFTAGETNQALVALRISATGGAIAANFVGIQYDAEGVMAASINQTLDVNVITIQDSEGSFHNIEPPAGTNWKIDNTAIKAKTDLIGTGSATVSAPVTPSGVLSEIIIGDDYLVAHGRQFIWTVTKPGSFDATGATCWFGGKYNGCQKWLVQGTIVDNGATLTLTFELPKAKTKSLKAGNYDWSVAIHDAAGNQITSVKSGSNSVALAEKFTNS